MLKELTVVCVLVVAACGSYDEDHEHHEPQPYHFGYEIKDTHGSQFRREKSNGNGHVEGSYGYTDENGIYREVHYIADESGFRAHVKTNEPGTANQDSAAVKLHSSAKKEEEYSNDHAVEHDYDDNEYRRSDDLHLFKQRQGEHGGHE